MRPVQGPANRLELVLRDAFRDPGHRPEFYRLLLDADLFVIGRTGREVPGEYVAGPGGEEICVAAWKRDGKTLVPVFTSLERLNEAAMGPTAFIQLNGRALLEVLDPKATILLNPGCSMGKEMPPEEIRSLLDGSLFGVPRTESLAPGTPFEVAPPKESPDALIGALRTLFAKHRDVQAAFLARIHVPGSHEPPHFLIGLLGDGDVRPVIAEANLVAKNLLAPGEPLDFIDIGADEASLGLVKKTTPFYTR
ncbi:MAG: enhanced serine sensitivity protein SseB C-terminal domain-containing protein [Elusimicrobia bacterium]|nr:enhanced serine sensitivity protein SseB C-terminal domain-containing protein [Elusimicrobiota bacterium]